jgi:hypothetical protein
VTAPPAEATNVDEVGPEVTASRRQPEARPGAGSQRGRRRDHGRVRGVGPVPDSADKSVEIGVVVEVLHHTSDEEGGRRRPEARDGPPTGGRWDRRGRRPGR